jgi:site-specific DNA-methyltransferase (adenine-specific)
VSPQGKENIFERVNAGERQEQVAADFGLSQPSVSKIVTAERKKAEAKKEREEQASKIVGDCGVVHSDFRKSDLADSIDLIFTDPPYDDEAMALYADLARFAARALRPGGWLLTYSGQAHLPHVMDAMRVDGLIYGWTFCVLHSGGDLRFRKFKIQNGWKPLIGFYRPPLAATWDWFKDVVTGGKEKESHEWQQSEAEAGHFIERLSAPGGFVCDPFCGSGTTLAAAKALERRWIGFEIEAEHVKTARVRVA